MHNKGCLPDMKNMPDNKYGLAIVDPPYGIIGSWHSQGTNNKSNKHKSFDFERDSKWDTPPDLIYFEQLKRISKDQIIWGANHFIQYIDSSRGWIIWDKKQPEGIKLSKAELAYSSFNTNIEIFRYRAASQVNKIHSCQKPVEVYKFLLKKYGFYKDGSKRTIFDSHAGSMSLVCACLDLGFDIDCWEIDKDYFEAAQKRINKHKKKVKLRLFKTGKYYEN